MARTAEGAALTEIHRQIQASIALQLTVELGQIWSAVDPTDLRGTLDSPLRAIVLAVLRRHGVSALAARQYWDRFRRAEGIAGTHAPKLVAPPPELQVRGLLLGAGVSGIQKAAARGETAIASARNGLVKVVGSATGLIANAGRNTILGSLLGDREAIGYQRVTDGKPCAFCAMVASRGIFSKDEAGAGFKAHGHCGCTAEPAYRESQIIPRNATYKEEWNKATVGKSDKEALNAFRQHLAAIRAPATG